MSRRNRNRLGTPVRRRVDIAKEERDTSLRLRMGGNSILGLRVIDPGENLVEVTGLGKKPRQVTVENIRLGAPLRFTAGQADDQTDSTVQGIYRY